MNIQKQKNIDKKLLDKEGKRQLRERSLEGHRHPTKDYHGP